MIPLTHLKNKSLGVFGLGKAGAATVESLLAGGAEVFAWDDKEESIADVRRRMSNNRHGPGCEATIGPSMPQAGSPYNFAAQNSGDDGSSSGACVLLPVASWPWEKLEALVLAPGVPLTHEPHPVVVLARRHGVPVIGDIELLYQACPDATYIGITGTNGKSTTTTLIAHILKSAGKNIQVGGNLGTAALSLEPLGKGGIYVLETSSYQLDLLKTMRFHIAVFLNITPDHLDRHGTMEDYIAAKMHIFDRQAKTDVAAVAVDDAFTEAVARTLIARGAARVIPASVTSRVQDGVYVDEQGVLRDVIGGSETFAFDIKAQAPRLPGKHNWQNAAAAYIACKSCGVEPAAIGEGLKSFQGLAHRLEFVAAIDGVQFINDSKATNADATANALDPYDNIYWIVGGKPKEGGIAPLARFFPKIRHAFLIGQAAPEFARTLEGHVPYTQCGTLAVAFEKAAALALGEGARAVVLLSPACASWDQWKNFEERGLAFCAMVEKLRDKAH